MSLSPACILYSQDPDVVRRFSAFLGATAQVRHVSIADRLDPVLQQTGPALLLLDLRAKEAMDLFEQVRIGWPEVLIVAFGTPRSEPLREVEQAGAYASEELQVDRRRLQTLVARGLDVLEPHRDGCRSPCPTPQHAAGSR